MYEYNAKIRTGLSIGVVFYDYSFVASIAIF